MKKSLIIIFLLLSFFSLKAENRVSISTKGNRVFAEIEINPNEYIIFKEDFLFLNVISDKYSFVFSGYPKGELQENGDIYYSGKLRLEGKLILLEGVEPGDYEVEVVLGYQTCDEAGYCNIPVEISQSIVVSEPEGMILPLLLFIVLISISIFLIILIKRKKS